MIVIFLLFFFLDFECVFSNRHMIFLIFSDCDSFKSW